MYLFAAFILYLVQRPANLTAKRALRSWNTIRGGDARRPDTVLLFDVSLPVLLFELMEKLVASQWRVAPCELRGHPPVGGGIFRRRGAWDVHGGDGGSQRPLHVGRRTAAKRVLAATGRHPFARMFGMLPCFLCFVRSLWCVPVALRSFAATRYV